MFKFCGRAKGKFRPTKIVNVDHLMEAFPELEGMEMPIETAKATKRSLAIHGSMFNQDAVEPPKELVETVVDTLVDNTRKAYYDKHGKEFPRNCALTDETGRYVSPGELRCAIEDSYEHFMVHGNWPATRLIKSIRKAAEESNDKTSAGVPLNHICSKKGPWLENMTIVIEAVLGRLYVLLDGTEGGLDAVRKGACDPVFLFIKSELHPLRKVKEGRFRLIAGVSLIDSIIDRLLNSHVNKAEIATWEDLPFKPGMGLNDEGLQKLFTEFCGNQKKGDLSSTDISGWDWSVFWYLLSADRDYRVKLSQAPEGSAYALLMSSTHTCRAKKVLQTSDGAMFEQMIMGIMCSGWYNTSSTNSHMRVILAQVARLMEGHANLQLDSAMGDDAVEQYTPGLADRYKKLGFRVRGGTKCPPKEFSFCSMNWKGNWQAEPENWRKSMFKYLLKNPRDPDHDMHYSQFYREMRHSPEILRLKPRIEAYKSLLMGS